MLMANSFKINDVFTDKILNNTNTRSIQLSVTLTTLGILDLGYFQNILSYKFIQEIQ